MVSLRENGEHVCGGAILDEINILTTARCIRDLDISTLTIKVGNNSLNAQTEEYPVSKLIPHEDYDHTKASNDIAIIKVANPIEFREGAVQPVTLRQTNIDDLVWVILSGWGHTSSNGNKPNKLQAIYLKTLNYETCAESHSSSWPVTESNVCTFTTYGEGLCEGDTGSPLVDMLYRLVGLSSFGKGCGIGYPDVYTRVHSYLDWIEVNRS